MKELKKYQNDFMGLIREKGGEDLLARILPIGKISNRQVVEVYQNDYTSRLTEALGETFEATWFSLGDEDFFKVAKEYIHKNPSQVKDLNNYGESFPAFLEDYDSTMPWLKELAQFEWDFWNLFHFEGFLPIDVFSKIKEEELLSSRFAFQETLMIRSWDYSLFNIWKNRDDVEITPDELKLNEGQNILLFKQKDDLDVRYHEFSDGQFQILKRLFEGFPLLQALEEAEIEDPSQVSELFEFLRESRIVKELL